MAPGEPLLRALTGLRFQHEAHCAGFLPRARWGCPDSKTARPRARAGLGRAGLKVGGRAFVSGLDIGDLLPPRLRLVTAEF